ncbi:hypothetical protein K439DRAFT_657516 [Ramaria rubella]|nr:hypothetical protein K439DRAFT_657516 [Ramaria rubella]
MSRSSLTEISMRHFPDLSDASFQIPHLTDDVQAPLGGVELDFDAFDEGLRSLDSDPFATPLPHPRSQKHAPLTLSEITPRREHEPRPGMLKERDSDEARAGTAVILSKEFGGGEDGMSERQREKQPSMGIDLSSKSTARLRHQTPSDATQPEVNTKPNASSSTVPSDAHVESRNDMNKPKSKAVKRPALGKDAGVTKSKPRLPSSKGTVQPKSILKSAKPATSLPPSTLTRTLTAASQTPQAKRPKWGEVAAEVYQTSQRRNSSGSGISVIGGGLIDMLVMYGEKLKGSLGFPSEIGSTTSQAPNLLNTHSEPFGEALRPAENLTQVSSHQDISPPSRPLTLSDLTPSRHQREAGYDIGEPSGSQPTVSPMRPSKKRSSAGALSQEHKKKGRVDQNAGGAPKSFSQIIPGNHNPPAMKGILKPTPLGPSRAVNNINIHPHPRNRPDVTENAHSKPHRPKPVTSVRDLNDKSTGKATAAPQSGHAPEKQRPEIAAALPGPGDVYHERALDKARKQQETKEGKENQGLKAGAMPLFSKPAPPARPTVRPTPTMRPTPTVPASFTFHSEARMAQRNAEFEGKRKIWETRRSRS